MALVFRLVIRRHTFVALVTLAAVAAHATALAGGFLWLDHAHLGEGLALASPAAWPSLFTRGFAGTGFYRPLMSLSLSVDAALGGAPWLYHATTLAWHGAAAVTTMFAGRALGLAPRAAALAAVLFAVHPVTSLVAGAIAFRSESMMAVALLSLIVFHRRGWPWAAALAVAAGALVKETALLLAPLFIAALESSSPHDRRARRRLLAAEGLAFAAALALRLAFAPAWRASPADLDGGAAAGTRLAALLASARALLVAGDRTVCDAFPVTSVASLAAFAGAVVGVVVCVLAWKRRGPALLLALSLLPVLNLVPLMRWWSPHYLYLPLAFLAMLAAEVATRDHRRLVVAAAIAAGLAVVAALDGRRFRSDETLWTREVALQPACREGHFYLGETARRGGRWEAAAAHYQAAVAAKPGVLSYVDRGAALQNLGVVRLEQRRFAEAGAAFRAARHIASDEGERRRLTHNLATAELAAGNPAEAARLLEPEARRRDAFAPSLWILARAARQLGRHQEAAALVARLRAGTAR